MAWAKGVEERWRALSEEVLVGFREWRDRHPKATLVEIEAALDERWAAARARMLADAALASAAADLTEAPPGERPVCGGCGGELRAHGLERRSLTTARNRAIQLERSQAECPTCGRWVFPPG